MQVKITNGEKINLSFSSSSFSFQLFNYTVHCLPLRLSVCECMGVRVFEGKKHISLFL
jgi:phospholipid N-methyltransferase